MKKLIILRHGEFDSAGQTFTPNGVNVLNDIKRQLRRHIPGDWPLHIHTSSEPAYTHTALFLADSWGENTSLGRDSRLSEKNLTDQGIDELIQWIGMGPKRTNFASLVVTNRGLGHRLAYRYLRQHLKVSRDLVSDSQITDLKNFFAIVLDAIKKVCIIINPNPRVLR